MSLADLRKDYSLAGLEEKDLARDPFRQFERRFQEAEAALTEALRLDPSSSMLHLNLGNLQDQVGRKDEALKSYLKALALDPGSVNACYNLGLLYAELGKYQEAKKSFEAALKLAPDDAETQQQLRQVTKKLGETPP